MQIRSLGLVVTVNVEKNSNTVLVNCSTTVTEAMRRMKQKAPRSSDTSSDIFVVSSHFVVINNRFVRRTEPYNLHWGIAPVVNSLVGYGRAQSMPQTIFAHFDFHTVQL